MTRHLRPARPDDFATYYGDMVSATALESGGDVTAIGLILRQEGRLWGTLDVRPGTAGLALVRIIRKSLDGYGEPVWVECQTWKHATAERLLSVIGFEPTDEMRNGMRVWRYG